MLHRTAIAFPSSHDTARHRLNPTRHRYKEISKWQRAKMGLPSGGSVIPQRVPTNHRRFNPEYKGLSKGTSGLAWKWWFTQQPFLPQVAPEGYAPPRPAGAVPNAAWDDAFVAAVTALSPAELRKNILSRLTAVIFRETQRDGYELRQLDFEGKPTEALPLPRIIEDFVLEEETIRDRVVGQVVETDFRLSVTSADRRELKSAANIIDYVMAHVAAAQPEPPNTVADAVKEVLDQHPLQPTFGFQHALPTGLTDPTVAEWERLHHFDWQLGNAVYAPRSREETRGNLVWLREEQALARRLDFDEDVRSGRALKEHRARISEAAVAVAE